MMHQVDEERNATARCGVFCRCGLMCTTKANLQIHITSFNCRRNHECRICGERFVTSSFLRAHMETKHNMKRVTKKISSDRITCGDCGQYFTNRVDHRRHRDSYHDRITAGLYDRKGKTESPHGVVTYDPPKCKCGTIYANPRALALHMRSHLKPFHCHLCVKRFGYLNSVKFHMKSAHRIVQRQQAFECGRCVKTFLTLEEIIDHCKTYHSPDLTSSEVFKTD